MIRLLLTFVACVALQAAAGSAPTRRSSARGHQHSAWVSVGPARAASAGPQSRVAMAGVLPSPLRLAAPSWTAAGAARLGLHHATTRLWLRAARLLL